MDCVRGRCRDSDNSLGRVQVACTWQKGTMPSTSGANFAVLTRELIAPMSNCGLGMGQVAWVCFRCSGGAELSEFTSL